MILAIKTEAMTAELLLFEDSGAKIAGDTWEAGRSLAKDLLAHIDALIAPHGPWEKIRGIIIFRGPGSFTSLRIGITTANTIAYAKEIPIIGVEGENWLEDGLRRFDNGENNEMVLPVYGADPHITAPKK